MGEVERTRAQINHPRCPYCRDDVRPDDPKTACEACMAWHHRTCWSEHGTCSGCGARIQTGAGSAAPAPECGAPGCSRSALGFAIERTIVGTGAALVDLRDRCYEHGVVEFESGRTVQRVLAWFLALLGVGFVGYGLLFAEASSGYSGRELDAGGSVVLGLLVLGLAAWVVVAGRRSAATVEAKLAALRSERAADGSAPPEK